MFRKILSFLGFLVGAGFLLLILAGIVSLGVMFVSDRDIKGLEITSDHAVGVVELSGEIFDARDFEKQLRAWVEHKKIKAVVVRIDSPGGSVGASEEIYRMLKRAREKKPIVAAMGNVAASGGLYAAMGCNKVVANNGTLTGSIGVVFMMPNVSSVMDKLGVRMNVIKSGKFKDAGSPFRDLSAEEQNVLQGLIDRAYDQFVSVVADARALSKDEVKKFADGRIILGDEALGLKLIDEIGDTYTAGKLALELASDSAEPELIYKKKPEGIWKLFDVSEGGSAFSWLGLLSREATLAYRAFI